MPNTKEPRPVLRETLLELRSLVRRAPPPDNLNAQADLQAMARAAEKTGHPGQAAILQKLSEVLAAMALSSE